MKHLVDIDESALSAAQDMLGTVTIKDTINSALRRVSDDALRAAQIDRALALLGSLQMDDNDRQAAWR